jgi:hypothetical protein
MWGCIPVFYDLIAFWLGMVVSCRWIWETRRDRTILPHRGWSVPGPYQWFFVSANAFWGSLFLFEGFEDCLWWFIKEKNLYNIYRDTGYNIMCFTSRYFVEHTSIDLEKRTKYNEGNATHTQQRWGIIFSKRKRKKKTEEERSKWSKRSKISGCSSHWQPPSLPPP